MDNEAVNELYRRYRREIYLYLFSLCKNAELAEDLLQETFIKAMLALPDSHTNVRAWLYMVARNLYYNHRKRAHPSISLDDCEQQPTADGQMLESIIKSEQQRELYAALMRLEERKREVLQLQYFGGLSQNEIAAVLKLTAQNVRVLAYRAKRELKSLMEENGYDIS